MEINGLKVVEDKNIPQSAAKLKLSDDLVVSDKCRLEMDEWLLKNFGEEHFSFMFEGKYFVSPAVAAHLKSVYQKRNLDMKNIHSMVYS